MAVFRQMDGLLPTDKRTSSVNGSFNYQTVMPPSSSILTSLHLVPLENHHATRITSSSLMELIAVLHHLRKSVDFLNSTGEPYLLSTPLLQQPGWFSLGLASNNDHYRELELRLITSLYLHQVKTIKCNFAKLHGAISLKE